MSRILLVDDSPHAQRIGERILTDEGFEVVTVSNGDSALIRLEDVAPDLVLLKAALPGRGGFEICRFIKMSPRHGHVKVILTEAATETLDPAAVLQSGADGTIKKPFEASVLLDAVRPLAAAAGKARAAAGLPPEAPSTPPKPAEPKITAPVIAVIDPEQVRAAVTVALDAAMPAMVDDITQRVLAALTSRRQTGERIETRPMPAPPSAAAPPPVMLLKDTLPLPSSEPVRQVTRLSGSPAASSRPPARLRSGSFLGLNLEPEIPGPDPDSSERS